MTPGSGAGSDAAARAALRAALRDASADLLAYLERRVDPRADAADLLGEVMLTAWRRVDQLPEDRERRRMWLFTIAVHVVANHRRTVRRRSALAERLRGLLASPAPDPDPGEAHAVRDAVRRLPAAHRDLVTLVHWEGFTLAEAAEILGVNPSTARSRYAAAKDALHDALAVRAE